MIIIGELINASRKAIREAIERRDRDTIQSVARDQIDCGAHYIDLNAGLFGESEPECLQWLVETVQESTATACAIDSPNPRAIEAALKVHKGVPLINSISLERDRFHSLSSMLAGTGARIIGLCMSDEGMPESVSDRLKNTDQLVEGLTRSNIALEDIFIDPLVQPLSVSKDYGMAFLDAIEQIMARYSGIHTTCGLSNVSYGLPERNLINRTFMSMAICRGLDAAIVNPLDRQLMASVTTAEMLAGRDDFCLNYLKSYRSGGLKNM